jgi:hypothetical protein
MEQSKQRAKLDVRTGVAGTLVSLELPGRLAAHYGDSNRLALAAGH